MARRHTQSATGLAENRNHANPRGVRELGILVGCEQSEGECLQGIASQNGCGLAKAYVAGWVAATQVVVVHRWQVIMHQGIGVHHLNGHRWYIEARRIHTQCFSGGVGEHRAHPLATDGGRVTHGRLQLRAVTVLLGQLLQQRCIHAQTPSVELIFQCHASGSKLASSSSDSSPALIKTRTFCSASARLC